MHLFPCSVDLEIQNVAMNCIECLEFRVSLLGSFVRVSKFANLKLFLDSYGAVCLVITLFFYAFFNYFFGYAITWIDNLLSFLGILLG